MQLLIAIVIIVGFAFVGGSHVHHPIHLPNIITTNQ